MKLNSPVTDIPLVGPAYQKKLKKLGITSIEHLLHHIPSRYIDYGKSSQVKSLKPGDFASVSGELLFIRNQFTKTRKFIQIATIKDETGIIYAVWFNQSFLVKSLRGHKHIQVAGKIDWWGNKLSFMSPDYEIPSKKSIHTKEIVPVYPQTAGVSSKFLRSKIAYCLERLGEIDDFLPSATLKQYNLTTQNKSLNDIHFPKTIQDAQVATKRLSFNEFLFLHISSSEKKLDWNKTQSTHTLKVSQKKVDEFVHNLPFELTKSQKRSINEILNDLTRHTPMNRLLEGDVGSGKTVVAATACYVSHLNGFQSVIMAPTQILAMQHHKTLNQLFKNQNLKISLISSSTPKGEIPKSDIYVGTHALIHRKLDLTNTSLIVIDEQHRFGVEQRAHLTNTKNNQKFAPHVLTMTATPIPRTVFLTVYADLALSTLDELPKGRKKIKTFIVPKSKRKDAYNWINGQIESENIQVFVVCPLIEESESPIMAEVKAVKKEYENLKKVFSNKKLDILHGRLNSKEKESIINKFKSKKTDILISTPVIEVGIDIPNATIMLIEASERFGLAQLHQLRGRVGRGDKQSYCLLFTDSRSESVKTRLEALQKNATGFELAELDLKLRGPGHIFGKMQHGYHELRIASWQDATLIKNSKSLSETIMKYPNKYKKVFDKLITADIALN